MVDCESNEIKSFECEVGSEIEWSLWLAIIY